MMAHPRNSNVGLGFVVPHVRSARRKNSKSSSEHDIYRIVREALNNASKHARAHEILVLLDGSELKHLCLSISSTSANGPAGSST
jgi:signal transduction histidine kinase